MNLKTIFKRLILLDLSLIILIIPAVFFESKEVADFNMYFENDYSNALLIIVGIGLLIYLINLFLLYKFKSIGKQIYLILFIVQNFKTLIENSKLFFRSLEKFENVVVEIAPK